MQTGTLAVVVSMGVLLAGCGGGAAACPEPSTAPAAGPPPAATAAAPESARPVLEGAYRARELRKDGEVTDVEKALLSQAPSCYSLRMLWTFRKDVLGVSLDLLCDTSDQDHSVDLCTASLEMGIHWSQAGFQIPTGVRAGGVVDRYTLAFQPVPGGMKRTRNKTERSCNVSVKAGAVTVDEKRDEVVLHTAEGDLVLVPVADVEVDWDREVQRLYEERHGAR